MAADQKNYELKPALCLDFDGTIRYSKTGKFIDHPDDIILFPDVQEKIWEYRNNGFLIFGITNQAGVAFGYKSVEDVEKENQRTLDFFERDPFHIVQASFAHEKGRKNNFKYRSLMRKPNYGMLVLCEIEAQTLGYIVDWDNSIFVGDRDDDEFCALNAGIEFISAEDFFERKA
jgi:D-glycero-D-manno-heptose 1,7-bisphosphate phosphatase